MGKSKWHKIKSDAAKESETAKESEGEKELKNQTDSVDKPLELKALLDSRFDPIDLLIEIAEQQKKSDANDKKFEENDVDNPGLKSP